MCTCRRRYKRHYVHPDVPGSLMSVCRRKYELGRWTNDEHMKLGYLVTCKSCLKWMATRGIKNERGAPADLAQQKSLELAAGRASGADHCKSRAGEG